MDRIDLRQLQPAREQHRHFISMPNMARLIRSRPTAAAWDDHDFGRNNFNGVSINIGGNRSENALQSFREYHAHAQFGNGSEGVYHSDCMGVMEVFLLAFPVGVVAQVGCAGKRGRHVGAFARPPPHQRPGQGEFGVAHAHPPAGRAEPSPHHPAGRDAARGVSV